MNPKAKLRISRLQAVHRVQSNPKYLPLYSRFHYRGQGGRCFPLMDAPSILEEIEAHAGVAFSVCLGYFVK